MKTPPVLLVLAIACTTTILPCNAQKSLPRQTAHEHLAAFADDGIYSITAETAVADDQQNLLARVYHLSPQGYVVVPATTLLPKVIAYSFESNFGEPSESNPLYALLKADITKRTAYLSFIGDLSVEAKASAKAQSSVEAQLSAKAQSSAKARLDQWPATGDGWLKTNYTQTEPYNNLCPMDPVTQTRSYAGCPSVAMAMILDFHKSTNSTHFDDADDYYHSYAGRNYQIDDDYAEVGFASFPQLNEYLDTLNQQWLKGVTLSSNDKAALIFACGLACKQVYTSEGSGTFGVDQALHAYQRFGCTSAELLTENDTTLWTRLQQNIKDTLPAHLAVVDAAWQTGHNVVVDGYNTDDYYHINFGWGGSYNGWYLLPEEMPMGLTVVEGIVLDIRLYNNVSADNTPVSNCRVYPNPSSHHTYFAFRNPGQSACTLTIYNASGRVMECQKGLIGTEAVIDNTQSSPGLYLYRITDGDKLIAGGKFIVDR